MADLFTPPDPEPGWCWVCDAYRYRPLGCGPTCMEQDYPQPEKDTTE